MDDEGCSVFISTPRGRTGSRLERAYFRLGDALGFDSTRRVIISNGGEQTDEIRIGWNTTATINFPVEDE